MFWKIPFIFQRNINDYFEIRFKVLSCIFPDKEENLKSGNRKRKEKENFQKNEIEHHVSIERQFSRSSRDIFIRIRIFQLSEFLCKVLGTLCATISHTAVLELVSPGFTDFQGRSSFPFPPFIYPCNPQWIIIDSPGWPLLFRTCFFILMVHLIVDYDRLEKITWLSGSRSESMALEEQKLTQRWVDEK